jgi:hypothetical protein
MESIEPRTLKERGGQKKHGGKIGSEREVIKPVAQPMRRSSCLVAL